jgi:hypothetical protein
MKFKNPICVLVVCIVILSLVATLAGILSNHGPGEYEYESIRGENVTISGKGYYHHMSSDVVVQGVAQDYVTLIIGIPLLLISVFLARRDYLKGKLMLAGTLGYFSVTYIFYLCLAMYNELFLVWVMLASASFYAFILSILSLEFKNLSTYFSPKLPVKFVSGFLIFNTIMIGMMWLGVVVPPLIDGTIYPKALEHYTTLIVQGLDLSILLPASFLSGVLLLKKRSFGYLLAPIYMVFLSILMIALIAKIIGMSLVGVNPGPAIIIIPLITAIAILLTVMTLKNINENKYRKSIA